MIRYEDRKLLQVVNVFTTLISSVLPVGSIIALYYINTMIVRLVMIGVFMIIFSTVLSFMTRIVRGKWTSLLRLLRTYGTDGHSHPADDKLQICSRPSCLRERYESSRGESIVMYS